MDPDQRASTEASWLGSTYFSKEGMEFWKMYACSALIRSNTVCLG